jgi:hypothetical protein
MIIIEIKNNNTPRTKFTKKNTLSFDSDGWHYWTFSNKLSRAINFEYPVGEGTWICKITRKYHKKQPC